MNRLFLSSYFSNVIDLFIDFMKGNQVGKKVTFIPTAANPEKIRFYVDSDRKALEKIGIIIDQVDISSADYPTIEKKIIENDMIFISGGNTFFLLQELKRTRVDELVIKEIARSKPYIGSSAGSIILSKNIEYVKRMDSPKKAPSLTDYSSLDVINFYPLPHYRNAPFKKISERIVEEYGDTEPVIFFV